MSHRTFADDRGRSWEVWEVHPEVVERRLNEERRSTQRATPERRQYVDIRFRMAPELRSGWLAFQSGNDRKRLAPIPRDWEMLSDEQLTQLVRAASSAPTRAVEDGDGAAVREANARRRGDPSPPKFR